jgi:hypothetical protein
MAVAKLASLFSQRLVRPDDIALEAGIQTDVRGEVDLRLLIISIASVLHMRIVYSLPRGSAWDRWQQRRRKT